MKSGGNGNGKFPWWLLQAAGAAVPLVAGILGFIGQIAVDHYRILRLERDLTQVVQYVQGLQSRPFGGQVANPHISLPGPPGGLAGEAIQRTGGWWLPLAILGLLLTAWVVWKTMRRRKEKER